MGLVSIACYILGKMALLLNTRGKPSDKRGTNRFERTIAVNQARHWTVFLIEQRRSMFGSSSLD